MRASCNPTRFKPQEVLRRYTGPSPLPKYRTEGGSGRKSFSGPYKFSNFLGWVGQLLFHSLLVDGSERPGSLKRIQGPSKQKN